MIPRKALALAAALLLAAAGTETPAQSAAPAGPGGSTKPTTLHIVTAQVTGSFIPLYVAQDEGFFAREGLEVTFSVASGSAAVASLASGEAQVLALGATAVAAYSVSGGDAVMIATVSNYPVFSLYAHPSIRTVEELAGMEIGITAFGTSTETFARLVLERYGLAGKVKIVGMGGSQGGIFAALQKGVLAGGILAPPYTAQASAAGFRKLVDGLRLGVPMNMNAIDVRRSYVAAHRDVVVRFLRAYLAAWRFVRNPSNRTATIQAYAHHAGFPVKLAGQTYDAYYPVWFRSSIPTVDRESVANVLRFSGNPTVSRVDPGALINNSLLTDVARSP